MVEQQLELAIPEQGMPQVNNSKQGLILFISIFVVLFVICFVFSGILFYKYISLNKVVDDLVFKSSDNAVKINDIASKLPNNDLTKVNNRLDDFDRRTYLMNMQHRIEDGVVTDDFIVHKAFITSIPPIKEGANGLLLVTLDLDNQPSAYSKYKGQGKFSVPDRELKSMIQDVLQKVEDRYKGSDEVFKGLPQWKDGTVTITIKNYEIGTYNGEFKLKGE